MGLAPSDGHRQGCEPSSITVRRRRRANLGATLIQALPEGLERILPNRAFLLIGKGAYA